MEQWNALFPKAVAVADLKTLQAIISPAPIKHYTIRNAKQELLAWLAVYPRYDVNWFSLLVSEGAQGQGIGRRLLKKSIDDFKNLYGWAVDVAGQSRFDGSAYHSPLKFYERLGFAICSGIRPPVGDLPCCLIHYPRDAGVPDIQP